MRLDKIVRSPPDSLEKVFGLAGFFVSGPENDSSPRKNSHRGRHRKAEFDVIAGYNINVINNFWNSFLETCKIKIMTFS